MKTPPKNLYDIQCPACGSYDDLYILDESDPTPRVGFRFCVSEDGKSATPITDPGEWLQLGPYWLPEEFDRVKAFCARLGGRLPVGCSIWCTGCGSQRLFEECDGEFAVKAAQVVALTRVIRKLFPSRE